MLLERLDQEYIQQQEEELQSNQSNDDDNTREGANVAMLWDSYRDVLEPIFMKLLARYILVETKTSSSSNKISPYDGVARFHLGNGAQLYRINLAANLFPGSATTSADQPSYHNSNSSRLSWMQSWGIMVNYRYQLSDITMNQEHYQQQHGSVHRRIPVSNHLVQWIPAESADTAAWLQDEGK